MGTLEQNLAAWDRHHTWSARGDEWSREWGGAAPHWHGSLWPRVRPFLPAATVLEIAPGFGRWTQFLAQASERLIAVDLSTTCIDACRERFADVRHAVFHVNDGRSLSMVDDGSIDFAFSFDSLVHVESDVLGSYLAELARTLRPDGVAFLHHSNLGEYAEEFKVESAMSDEDFARQGRARPPSHWRAPSGSAALVRQLCPEIGLTCVGQEILNWGGDRLIDCISLVTPGASRHARETVIVRNTDFMAEARSIRTAAAVFTTIDAGQPRLARPASAVRG